MMNSEKITPSHLERNAYLYVRQSSMHQVYEHTESTKRQYALADRAIALGWDNEKVITIDSDLGQSGAQSSNRDGFKKLVAEVGMGNAGIVIGIEVSRLARNSSDWHRLLEICALTETLILDEDGLYNPNNFNDRLLLGMKGTMSEAELHYLKARMWGGRLAKAKRGELKIPLPVGFVYGEDEKVHMDPDVRVQNAIKTVFETFRKKRTAHSVMLFFKKNDIRFPTAMLRGPYKGQTVWGDILYTRVIQVLKNPRYAGVFSYGKIKTRKTPDGVSKYLNIPRDKLYAFIKDAHIGYITFEEYEENQKILAQNASSYGVHTRKGPPREGSALLQGIILCGICGRRMHVRYRKRGEKTTSDYYCSTHGSHGKTYCQTLSGRVIDESVSGLLLDSFTPMAVDMVFQIQEELKKRLESLDKIQIHLLLKFNWNSTKSRNNILKGWNMRLTWLKGVICRLILTTDS